MVVSQAPSRALARTRRSSVLRATLAGCVATGLVGVMTLAPQHAPADAVFYEVFSLQPGEMPSQELIAAATANADFYAGELQISRLPDPEPEPKPETKTTQTLTTQATQQTSSTAETAAVAAPLPYSGGGEPAEWMAAAGIDPANWGYVNAIVSRESGWNPNATNSSSGACGLVQAYPCSKVSGSGYNPIDNLRWAEGYAVGRYGSWAEAVAFWNANHWW